MGSTSILHILAGTALLGSALIVAVHAEDGAGKLVFHHQVHLEEGLECTDCHDTSKQPPGLEREICTDCHDEAPANFRLPATAARLPFTFQHVRHSSKLDCLECHRDTADEKQKAGTLVVEFQACMACHEKHQAPVAAGRCVTCHGVDQASVQPADHRVAWLKRHGRESRWRNRKRHGEACTQCHRVDTCQSCHRTRRPESHTALWRTRLHGFEAEWDRESCKTCHETGTCVQCHRTTKPQNHTGSRVSVHPLVAQSTGNQTCLVCHSTRFCADCHEG